MKKNDLEKERTCCTGRETWARDRRENNISGTIHRSISLKLNTCRNVFSLFVCLLRIIDLIHSEMNSKERRKERNLLSSIVSNLEGLNEGVQKEEQTKTDAKIVLRLLKKNKKNMTRKKKMMNRNNKKRNKKNNERKIKKKKKSLKVSISVRRGIVLVLLGLWMTELLG